MSRDIFNTVKDIVIDIVDDSEIELTPDADFVEDLGLDSLRALEILAAIENEFGIMIDPDKLKDMTTLNKVVDITKIYLED